STSDRDRHDGRDDRGPRGVLVFHCDDGRRTARAAGRTIGAVHISGSASATAAASASSAAWHEASHAERFRSTAAAAQHGSNQAMTPRAIGCAGAAALWIALHTIGYAVSSQLRVVDATSPKFDVASIKENTSTSYGGPIFFQPGGLFTATNTTVRA